MRVRKLFKKIAAVSLAVLVAVTAIPYSSPVKADNYPEYISFPVRILDFPRDDMLMEFFLDGGTEVMKNAYYSFELYKDYFGGRTDTKYRGKGMVKDELTEVKDEYGNSYMVPEYKKEILEVIANGAYYVLHNNVGANNPEKAIMRFKTSDGEYYNPLSMHRYIQGWQGQRDIVEILTANTNALVQSTNGQGEEGYVKLDELPEDLWKPKNPEYDQEEQNYKYKAVTHGDAVSYITSNYPEFLASDHINTVVFEAPVDDLGGVKQEDAKPVYALLDDGHIVLLSDIPVSKTFNQGTSPGIKGTYTVNESLEWGESGRDGDGTDVNDYKGKVKITVNDVPIVRNSYVRPDRSFSGIAGEMEVIIQMSNPDADISAEDKNQLSVGNIVLDPYENDIPLGSYEESKAKFDSDPKLGKTHITTCMDYAYFMTSHFFIPHESTGTNKTYNDYNKLIFHKMYDQEGEMFYEFNAAQKTAANNAEAYHLIYNADERSIRNWVPGKDEPDSVKGDKIWGKPGYFFILDGMWEDSRVSTQPDALGQMQKDIFSNVATRPAGWEYDSSCRASDGYYHNFNFTLASNSKFVYKRDEKQYFYFSGDDDVYIFVNGHLYIDLGGSHAQLDGKIYLPDIEDAHPDWIKEGEVVDFDLFFMERRSTSSNFYSKLNFKLGDNELVLDNDHVASGKIPYGELVDLDYKFSVSRLLTTNTNFTFKDDFGNVVGAEGFELGEGVSLNNNKLIVTVKRKDGNTELKEFEFTDPHNLTSAEVQPVMDYFKSLKLVNKESVSIAGLKWDSSVKGYDDYDTSSIENEKFIAFNADVSYDSYMDMTDSGQMIEGQQTRETTEYLMPVTVLTDKITVCTASDDNGIKELDEYGKFAVYRDLTEESIFAQSYNYINNPENDPKVPPNEKILEKYPRGKYTIMLDQDVLTSYKITINDEEPQDVKVIIKEGDGYKEVEGLGLTIDFEPSFDPGTKEWTYPDVKFELKAKRNAPSLYNLT